jgi:hypothetical protein
MSSIVRHVCVVVASLTLVGIASAQGTTTKPGSVPVPQKQPEGARLGTWDWRVRAQALAPSLWP